MGGPRVSQRAEGHTSPGGPCPTHRLHDGWLALLPLQAELLKNPGVRRNGRELGWGEGLQTGYVAPGPRTVALAQPAIAGGAPSPCPQRYLRSLDDHLLPLSGAKPLLARRVPIVVVLVARRLRAVSPSDSVLLKFKHELLAGVLRDEEMLGVQKGGGGSSLPAPAPSPGATSKGSVPFRVTLTVVARPEGTGVGELSSADGVGVLALGDAERAQGEEGSAAAEGGAGP